MKASLSQGTEIDWTATYLEADSEAMEELPFMVREYLTMIPNPPRPAVVLESCIIAGERATLKALREHAMWERISGTH